MFLDRTGKGDRLRASVFAKASTAPVTKYEVRPIFKDIVGRRGAQTYDMVLNETQKDQSSHLVTVFLVEGAIYIDVYEG